MAPRRVAALLALAAGSEAAWTVRWPHTAATATLLPAQPRLRLLRRECSASSSLPTARRRPRACTARPASSRASACATAGAPTHLSHRACPALRRCKRRMGGSCTAAPALLSAQDTLGGPRPVRLQAQVRQPLDELVGPLVQERGGGQGVGVPLEDVRDGYGGDAARRSHPNPTPDPNPNPNSPNPNRNRNPNPEQVKRGRREIGDRDTYDFKLQCSGHP